MSNTRDDFTSRTKSDLALRASYFCSNCKCSTVGPSDEASDAVTMIGIAAHISAASAGRGARRYDPSLTPSERSHIDNGIWLCGTCSILIDRDEQRFSVKALLDLKKQHEASRRIHRNGGADAENIIAVGPLLIALGSVVRSGPEGIQVRISHFLQGSIRDLWSLTQDFKKWPRERRYVLLNGVHRENGNFRTISPADSPKPLRCAVGIRMEYTSLRRQDDYSPHVRLGSIFAFSDAAASTSTTST